MIYTDGMLMGLIDLQVIRIITSHRAIGRGGFAISLGANCSLSSSLKPQCICRYGGRLTMRDASSHVACVHISSHNCREMGILCILLALLWLQDR